MPSTGRGEQSREFQCLVFGRTPLGPPQPFLSLFFPTRQQDDRLCHWQRGPLLERGFCECLKGFGYQENTGFFLLVLVLGRTTTNSVFQMVVFLWGFTVLFGFSSSFWIWQQGGRVPSTGRGEQSREFQCLVFGRTPLGPPQPFLSLFFPTRQQDDRLCHWQRGPLLERGFCECLKGFGYQETTGFFLLVLVLGRTTTNSVFQMVVFLWGFTILMFEFLSSYWIWQ